MSLKWNIENVENWKQKKKIKRNRDVLESLIWATLCIGIRKITRKNVKQFYVRLSAYEHLRDSFLHTKSYKPSYITFEEVENWIGLSTNADEFSAAQFEKRLCYE